MRVLVTGGAGFIGSTLVDRLLAEGHDVDVIDDLSKGSLTNLAGARASTDSGFSFHRLDIRSPEVVDLISRRAPEVIFHLAAQADVRVSVADPVFDADVNLLGTLRILEGARAAGAQRVVFAASGGTLYGEPDVSELPLKESLPQHPLSPYGVSKKAALDYLLAYREMHSLEFAALALANVYGPRQDPHGEAGVVAIFAERLLRGQPVTIFGDGEQTRDFVYVDDVVDGFVLRGASSPAACPPPFRPPWPADPPRRAVAVGACDGSRRRARWRPRPESTCKPNTSRYDRVSWRGTASIRPVPVSNSGGLPGPSSVRARQRPSSSSVPA